MRRTTSNEPYGIEDTGWLCIKRRGSAWARKRRGLPTRAQDALLPHHQTDLIDAAKCTAVDENEFDPAVRIRNQHKFGGRAFA